jgi:glycerophosphoryl diester phosphodiesterase
MRIPCLKFLCGFFLMTASVSAVEIIAHRGASHDAPENTVAAIKLAWEQGADGSEFDVYLSSDQQIVVIHDKDTKRTGGGVEKLVAKSTLAELQQLDFGLWKDPKYRNERIPTIADMFATVPAGKKVFVEVKCGPEIVPALDKALTASKLKPEQTPIIAFDARVIAELKKVRPDVPAYWLMSLNKKDTPPPSVESVIAKAREIKADGLDLSASPELDEAYAKAIHEAKLPLYVWTVNKPDVAQRMVKLGVVGITTDRPQWLREQLGK